jgi:hypothetical protein
LGAPSVIFPNEAKNRLRSLNLIVNQPCITSNNVQRPSYLSSICLYLLIAVAKAAVVGVAAAAVVVVASVKDVVVALLLG